VAETEIRGAQARIEIHKALKSWYMTPGIQRELRKRETEAVQVVLEVLERRRAAQKLTQG